METFKKPFASRLAKALGKPNCFAIGSLLRCGVKALGNCLRQAFSFAKEKPWEKNLCFAKEAFCQRAKALGKPFFLMKESLGKERSPFFRLMAPSHSRQHSSFQHQCFSLQCHCRPHLQGILSRQALRRSLERSSPKCLQCRKTRPGSFPGQASQSLPQFPCRFSARKPGQRTSC